MKHKNSQQWQDFPELDSVLFFAQRLDELLFDYSLDSYKAPALTSTFLCQEALSLIEDIETGEIEQANLPHILEELSWSLSNDITSKSLLLFDVNKYILPHENTPIHEKKLRLEILSKEINPQRYIEVNVNLIIDAIRKGHKKDIDSLARSYVSTLINIGISKNHLYIKTQEFFFHTQPVNEFDDLIIFFDGLMPVIHNFEVYFLVSGQIEIAREPLAKFNIEILTAIPDELGELAKAQNFILQNNHLLVKISGINAFDIHSGREAAERKLERIRDMFVFFSHKTKISWDKKTLVKQCCLSFPLMALQPKSPIEKCIDVRPKIGARRLSALLENIQLDNGGTKEKFDRIIDIHGVCVSNDVPENQLINLWTAIETITPNTQSKNKINNVIEKIIPVLMLLYIRRILERVTSDLFNWNRSEVSKIYREIPDSKKMPVQLKTLLLLGLESNKGLLDELQSKITTFPLLRFRLFQLSDTFRKPVKVKALFDVHNKKIAWQLRRIYRTRNLIVHSGRAPSYLNTLIENAHDYLDSTIYEMINLSCGSLKISTLSQVFEYSFLKYTDYLKNIPDTGNFSFDQIVDLYYDPKEIN